MGIWEAMEKLSELVDDSDPDVCVSQHSAPFALGRRTRTRVLLFLVETHQRPGVSTLASVRVGILISCAFFS
jgi:hypothetical protein